MHARILEHVASCRRVCPVERFFGGDDNLENTAKVGVFYPRIASQKNLTL